MGVYKPANRLYSLGVQLRRGLTRALKGKTHIPVKRRWTLKPKIRQRGFLYLFFDIMKHFS
jgi:hypothetical protein